MAWIGQVCHGKVLRSGLAWRCFEWHGVIRYGPVRYVGGIVGFYGMAW